jgi:transcriptional regulator with XRE-family HTH domain
MSGGDHGGERQGMPRKGPDARDRAIGSTLRRLREGLNKSQVEVAEALDWTTSKLSRTESGLRRIEVEDAAAILGRLGIGGDEFDNLIDRVKQPRTSAWWEQQPGVPAEAGTLAAYQQEADRMTNWGAHVVPGLLQRQEYAEDFMTKAGYLPHEIGLRWLARSERQKDALNRVVYTAILGEAALLTPFGGRDAFREQLRHIREIADQHTVLVLPEHTPTPALLSPWLLMEFPEETGMEPIAQGEFQRSVIFFIREQAVPYLQERDALLSLATSATESRKLIERALAKFT